MDLKTTNDNFITKLNINDKSYYVKVLWQENDKDLFQIKLFDSETAWSGTFSYDFADEFRKYIRKNFEEYCNEVRKCLEEQSTDYKYEFLMVQDEVDSAILKWSKSFDDLLVPYVSVSLKRDDVTYSKDTLIDFLIHQNKDLKHTANLYNQKNEELKVDLEKYKTELEEFVNNKNSMENRLYGRFVQLLNEKKRRISLLES